MTLSFCFPSCMMCFPHHIKAKKTQFPYDSRAHLNASFVRLLVPLLQILNQRVLFWWIYIHIYIYLCIFIYRHMRVYTSSCSSSPCVFHTAAPSLKPRNDAAGPSSESTAPNRTLSGNPAVKAWHSHSKVLVDWQRLEILTRHMQTCVTHSALHPWRKSTKIICIFANAVHGLRWRLRAWSHSSSHQR